MRPIKVKYPHDLAEIYSLHQHVSNANLPKHLSESHQDSAYTLFADCLDYRL